MTGGKEYRTPRFEGTAWKWIFLWKPAASRVSYTLFAMGIPKEIDNIEPFPTPDREEALSRKAPDQSPARMMRTEEKGGHKRRFSTKNSFTPSSPMRVEYWHQGDRAETNLPKKKLHSRIYAKRADDLGLLLLASAMAFIVFLGVVFFVSTRMSHHTISVSKPASPATINFYLGNHAFTQKVANERAAKLLETGNKIHGSSPLSDNLEVSLHDQISSMSDKMEKMHLEQQMGEPLPAEPDMGTKPDLMMHVKPTKDENFRSPLEFNNTLPKAIQSVK